MRTVVCLQAGHLCTCNVYLSASHSQAHDSFIQDGGFLWKHVYQF